AVTTPAKPLLHPLFSDQAVLQRGKPVAVWGWAAPGSDVTVALTGSELTAKPITVKAAADGRWQAALGPFVAGGPYVLTASSGADKVEAKDVLIGDVWLCSGQSNMEMVVSSSLNATEEAAQANWPQIRHLTVERTTIGSPQQLIKGQWKVANPENTPKFSAVGYFMARKLYQELKIPIGLVNSSWGGTAVQAWTSAEVLAKVPGQESLVTNFKALVSRIEAQEATGKTYAELMQAWYQSNDPGITANTPWFAIDLKTEDWTVVRLPPYCEDAGSVPATFAGPVGIRREFNLPASASGKPAVLTLGRPANFDTVWVNGEPVGTSEAQYWNRRYTIPASAVKEGRNIIAIRITNFAGKGGVPGKPEALTVTPQGGEVVSLAGDWALKAGADLSKTPPLPTTFARSVGATSLYNGMIAPLVPMTFTGAIWYQGEANAGAAASYHGLLSAMITDWRTRLGQGDFPFLIVSLANFMERIDTPSEAQWAELREAQAVTAKKLPACGLAIAIDIGDAQDIHPKNKQEVGRRLALNALALVYGQQIEWSGPWYRSMVVDGSTIRLQFEHLGGGLVASDNAPLTGFAIAGEDRQFVWAEAKIDGDTIVVSAPTVAKPVAVRYAWANNPACNLANKAGLPAVPFRTDDWPRPVVPKK
ncbi:MAG: sialate O-acetylesterase, partial [Planctomycetota bacterium]